MQSSQKEVSYCSSFSKNYLPYAMHLNTCLHVGGFVWESKGTFELWSLAEGCMSLGEGF